MPGNCSKKSQESDWAFDFRTSSRFFDDSDSDSALNDEDTLANTASTKNRLLDGIDLSTREETVVYKPNPFSIAKINAANRAQKQTHRAPTQGRQNISGSPLRRPSKLVSKPTQTKVLDGFKIQAHKESLRIKPAASPARRSQAMAASNAPVLAQEPSSHLAPNIASFSPLDSECVSSTVPIYRRMEGPSILSSNSVPLDNAHILARNSPIINYKKNFKEDLQKKALPTVPVSRNSIPPNSSAQFAFRFTQNFNSRPFRTALPMSSPLRGRLSAPATNLNDARFSSPGAAGPRSDIPSPDSIPYRRNLFKPSLPSARIESRISSVRPASNILTRVAMAERTPLDVHPRIKAERDPSTPPHEFVKESPPERSIPQQTFRSKAPIASSFSRNYNKPSVPDAYAFGSSDPDEAWSTLPSRKRKKPNPETFRMPSLTKPFLLPGIIPTDVLGRPQVKNVQNRRTVHVYVPPPLLHGNSKSNDRKGLQQNSDVPKANGSRNLTHTSFISLNSDAEIKSITDADVYPSPSRSRVSRPSSLVRGRTDVRLTPKSHPNPMYHPLSPPTSDLPIPGEDADIQFRLDPRDVRRKHPATKALFDKRTRDSYAFLLDILDLESCGVVFRDADADDLVTQEQNSEIGIPQWPSNVTRHTS